MRPEYTLEHDELKHEKHTIGPVHSTKISHWLEKVRRIVVKGVWLSAWLWNITFLAISIFGMFPKYIPNIFTEYRNEAITLEFFILALVLALVPIFGIVCMLTVLRTSKRKQVMYFYGVQAPALLFLLIRYFFFNELTSGSMYLFSALGCGLAAFAFHIFRSPSSTSPTPQSEGFDSIIELRVRMLGMSLVLCVGIYLFVLLGFHCIPYGYSLIREFFQFHWLVHYVDKNLLNPETFFSLGLFIGPLIFLTLSILTTLPFLLGRLYFNAWKETYQQFVRQHSTWTGIWVTGLTVLFLMAGGTHSNRQPQVHTFKLLKTPITHIQHVQMLLNRTDFLKRGLLNAYLSDYRYIGTFKQSRAIKKTYMRVFGVSGAVGQKIQDLYNYWIGALLYQGKMMYDEKRQAQKLYKELFDSPIQKQHKSEIIHALGSNSRSRRNAASILDVNQRKVHLVRQDIQIKEHASWARIELHEVYQNQTFQQKEIVYNFSLPDGVAVTGLWLSGAKDKKKAFRYVIAPRGAAQRIYKREIRRRIDPALLSQVGPRQYRLRIFPIPPKHRGRSNAVLTQDLRTRVAEHFHVWIQFTALAHPTGWRLPQITQKRNVYWDRMTQRSIRGKRVHLSTKLWLPKTLRSTRPYIRQEHRIQLRDGRIIQAKPLPQIQHVLPQNKRFAVIWDRSYSMRQYQKETTHTWNWIQQKILPSNRVDIYLTSPMHRPDRPIRLNAVDLFKAEHVVYFGAHNLDDMLKQFVTLRKKTKYHAVFVLTDRSSYDLVHDRKKPYSIGAPLWMIHAGGRVAQAYADSVLATLQKNQGDATTDIRHAFRQMAWRQRLQHDHLLNVSSGYSWHIYKNQPSSLPTSSRPTLNEPHLQHNRGLQTLAAQQWIQHAIFTGAIEKLSVLDSIHALAKQYSLVTPYSSMLVLVNQRQHKELASASRSKDRFVRTHSKEQQIAPAPSHSMLVGTPEPHEWALLTLVFLGLLYTLKKRKNLERQPLQPIG